MFWCQFRQHPALATQKNYDHALLYRWFPSVEHSGPWLFCSLSSFIIIVILLLFHFCAVYIVIFRLLSSRSSPSNYPVNESSACILAQQRFPPSFLNVASFRRRNDCIFRTLTIHFPTCFRGVSAIRVSLQPSSWSHRLFRP